MYKAIKFSIIFFSFLLLNGCASSCGSAVETNSNGNSNEVIVPQRVDNADVPSNANSNMVNGLANANMNNPTLDNSKVKVIDTSKAKSELPVTKLPDNSEVTVKSVGADFVETRVFKNHPQLEKVEKVINGKNIKYKVYLKSGKVSELEESKIKEYRKTDASTILKAVGVEPVEVKRQDTEGESIKVEEKLKKKPGN